MSEKKIPSDIFLEAFSAGVGSIRGTCGCCGRTCYASSEPYFNEGELEELERMAKKEIDKYIDFGDSTVSFGEIEGRQFIYGCPCEMESLFKYEVLFWTHRHQIIKYLVDITTERKRRADENHAAATRVEKAVVAANEREQDYGRQRECEALLTRVNKLIESTEREHYRLNIKDSEIEKEVDQRFKALLKEMREIETVLKKKVKGDIHVGS